MNKTYAEKWHEYRKRRNIVFVIFVAYLPSMFLFSLLFRNLFRFEASTAIAAITLILLFAVAVARANTWPCPRCGKWFHAKRFGSNPLTDRCLHCGLPKWADRDTISPDKLEVHEFLCFECGNVIQAGDSTCTKCGWSFQK